MKKLISLLLALTLVFSLAVSVAAADGEENGGDSSETPETPSVDITEDMTTVTLTKVYDIENTGTVSPAEEFKFTYEKTSVKEAAAGVTTATMPDITIRSVSYSKGDAGGENTKSKSVTITLPTYTSVGIYTYTIKETAGDTAGVTYYDDDIRLVVTVQQGADDKIRIAAVHTESGEEGDTTKRSDIHNKYSAGKLAIKKTVTGNLGDRTKEFSVLVQFNAPKGKTVESEITYNKGSDTITIPGGWGETKTVAITLSHDNTVTFQNIPYGVTYTVIENDYTRDGYDIAKYVYNGITDKMLRPATETPIQDEVMGRGEVEVEIINNKGVTVDTGVVLDNAPYIVLLAVAVIGLVVVIVKKRQARDY